MGFLSAVVLVVALLVEVDELDVDLTAAGLACLRTRLPTTPGLT